MKYLYLLFVFLLTSLSFAEDVIISINGSILDQSCNIKSSDLTKNVTFDNINPSIFDTIGSTSNAQKVSIQFENCTGNVSNLSYIFTGIADEKNSNLLKIIGKDGSNSENLAKGLAIQISNSNKEIIPLNKKFLFNQVILTEKFNFDFYLHYISTDSRVISGDASSLLYLDIFYE